jgi:serine/threonine-protein kinase
VPSGTVAGYRLERKLGAGGFGTVYLARREGRAYALKFIRLKQAEAWARREVALLVHLRHPHVVRLVGHVEWPEARPQYLVLIMEYVRGRTLYHWAAEENPTARQVARMMVKLTQAVEAVHAAGLLHRDLKGDNMLVREGGALVLVDFGAGAAPWAPPITRGGLAPGNLHYRSPEAVAFYLGQGQQAGARYRYTVADELYALGVSFYRLLTDVYPLEGEEDLVLADIVAVEPEAPREVNGRVPEALSALCLRLLEKEPGVRPASTRALREALEAALEEADASWDVPLCYGWDAQGLTTERPGSPTGPAPRSA